MKKQETLYTGEKAYIETLDGVKGCRIDQIFTVGIIKWYHIHLVGDHVVMTCRRKDLMSRREFENRRGNTGLS